MKFFKKCLAFLLTVFIIFGNLPLKLLPGAGIGSGGIFDIKANAYSVDGMFKYTVSGGYATIVGFSQFVSGDITIPASIGGLPVNEIGGFSNTTTITSVTIQGGIMIIDTAAFTGCTGLLSVSIPYMMTTINDSAFSGCTNLTEIIIPDSVTTLGSYAFKSCTALTNVVLGNKIAVISQETFNLCSSLKNITLPPGLGEIDKSAFYGCSGLTNVVIPSSVIEIQQEAFRACINLTGVSFTPPAKIQKLGSDVFYACNALSQITLPSTLTSFDDGVFDKCINLTAITIPYGTTIIPRNMFNSCGKLAYVSLPNTVKYIDENAFIWCTSLNGLALPDGLKTIGPAAFEHCAGLTNLNLPEGLQSVEYDAFANSGLKVVSLPSTLTELPGTAFKNCYDLLSVTFPDSLVNFGQDDFAGCYKLTIYCNAGSVAEQYALANSIPHIHIASFTVQFDANGGTPNMTYIQNCGTALTAPAVTRTGYTFTGWSPAAPAVMPAVNTTYTAQWSVNQYRIIFNASGGTGGTNTLMNYGAALTAPVVTKLLCIFDSWLPAVPSAVPAADSTYTAIWRPIYTYTVSDGTAIITDCDTAVSGALTIPSVLDGYTVTSLGYRAFEGCTGITSVIIPDTVTFIDGRAFYGCTGLTSVAIPQNVTSIGNSAFQNCSVLTAVTVPATLANIGGAAFANTAWINAQPDGPVYIGNVFYRYKGTMPAGTTVTLNAGTLGIAGSAFSGLSGLVKAIVPESLTVIGSSAFYNCTALTEIIIPQSVATIGTQAFQNCTALTIGCYGESYAHTYATANSIPHAIVVKITFDANGGTGGTVTVLYVGTAMTAPTVTRSSFVFNGWSPAVPALVPAVNTTYTAQWLTLLSYTINKEEVTITGLNTALTGRLTIPDTIEGYPVKYIAAGALKNKTGITGVDFPAGLLTIGEQAFRGCTGLTSITLPSALTSIDIAAFFGCTNLASITIPASVKSIGTDVFTGCTGLTIYLYPRSYAQDYAEGNHLIYKVFVTVTFSLNGGTGTVPSAQNGITGNVVNLPEQGDILRANYHFLGWATTASAAVPLASYTMAKVNVTLYAVWSLIPSVSVRSGSGTVIDAQSGFIYGLAPGMTQTAFESTYITLAGNGRLEYTLPTSGSFGTGTKVKVIDNINGAVISTYTVVIFGDVSGDGNIDSIDAGRIVDIENYMLTWNPVTDAALRKAADANGDGNIDSIDAGIIVDVENYMKTINQVTGLA